MTAASGGVNKPDNRPLARFVRRADVVMDWLASVFHLAANLCLFLMLLAIAVTILIRPCGLSVYWLWPWSMQVFVWMSFLGFYVVYRRRKDIAVDFVMRKLGPRAIVASRWFVALAVLIVIGIILLQMPNILASQVGVIDGVLLPWGEELQRYTLSIPLAASCALIFINALLDLIKAGLGWPEPASDVEHAPPVEA